MTLTTVAPAKINLTLEVLGKRDDGYHEIRSVIQTIELHDAMSFAGAEGLEVVYEGRSAPEGDLVPRAAAAFAAATGRSGVRIDVLKRIPQAAGLGGGSADAAATLRGLNTLWGTELDAARLGEIGASLGSDVAFFAHGGTALAEGRGEKVTPLPDAAEMWLVLLTPPIAIAGKTRAMYGALRPEDFSDGSRTSALVDRLASGGAIEESSLGNAFERAAFDVFEGLGKYRAWLLEAGSSSVHLCGAGPTMFALTSGEAEARAIRGRLTRPKMGERTWVVRTIGRDEATLVWEG